MTNHDFARKLALACFPAYKGRTIEAREFRGPRRVPSYWDGGSISRWAVLNTATGELALIPENGSPFSKAVDPIVELPPGCVLAEHQIIRGKDCGVVFYLLADDLARWFPPEPVKPGAELSWAETLVLVATRHYKSSTSQHRNCRFYHANRDQGITLAEYEAAKDSLRRRGLLSWQGAITDAGRERVPWEAYRDTSDTKLKREAWSATVAAEPNAQAPEPMPTPLAA